MRSRLQYSLLTTLTFPLSSPEAEALGVEMRIQTADF
jgi:hypothetical protein